MKSFKLFSITHIRSYTFVSWITSTFRTIYFLHPCDNNVWGVSNYLIFRQEVFGFDTFDYGKFEIGIMLSLFI